MHKKAKVKPPRLNGQRVGVFSTRSPYRPNNIGLSLVKIDKIQGASIHFSGIDILDGTPVLDIKPYIPEYDTPAAAQSLFFPIPNPSSDVVSATDSSSEIFNNPATPSDDSHCNEKLLASEDVSYTSRYTPWLSTRANKQPDLSSKEGCVEESNIEGQEKHNDSASVNSTADTVEKGFYSLSAALDKAGAALKQAMPSQNAHHNERKSETASEDPLVVGNLLEQDLFSMNDEDDILDSLVGDVICRAASDVVLGASKNITGSSQMSFHDLKSPSDKSCSGEVIGKTTATNPDSDENFAVTAPWLASPPVTQICVHFSVEAKQQLEAFYSEATDPRYRTVMLSGPEDAKKAITSILHEEPRSVYRRQKCQNSVYFFAVDVLHVTCWFDGDMVTVLRIKPAADVPQLQEKGSSSSCRLRDHKKE